MAKWLEACVKIVPLCILSIAAATRFLEILWSFRHWFRLRRRQASNETSARAFVRVVAGDRMKQTQAGMFTLEGSRALCNRLFRFIVDHVVVWSSKGGVETKGEGVRLMGGQGG